MCPGVRPMTGDEYLDCGGLCALPPLLVIAHKTTESGGNAKTPPQSKICGRLIVSQSTNTSLGHYPTRRPSVCVAQLVESRAKTLESARQHFRFATNADANM